MIVNQANAMSEKLEEAGNRLGPIRFVFVDVISDIPYNPRSTQLNISIPILNIMFPPGRHKEQSEYIRTMQLKNVLTDSKNKKSF